MTAERVGISFRWWYQRVEADKTLLSNHNLFWSQFLECLHVWYMAFDSTINKKWNQSHIEIHLSLLWNEFTFSLSNTVNQKDLFRHYNNWLVYRVEIWWDHLSETVLLLMGGWLFQGCSCLTEDSHVSCGVCGCWSYLLSSLFFQPLPWE